MLQEILGAIRGIAPPAMVKVQAEKSVIANGAYEAEDVVSEATSGGTPWLFKDAARENGGGGVIISALLTAETTNIASRFSLFLFTDVPTSELDDDDANTAPIVGDRGFYVGRIDFPTCDDIGTGMSETEAVPSTVGRIPKGFVCKSNSRALYGILAIHTTGDIADNTTLTISLIIEQV